MDEFKLRSLSVRKESDEFVLAAWRIFNEAELVFVIGEDGEPRSDYCLLPAVCEAYRWRSWNAARKYQRAHPRLAACQVLNISLAKRQCARSMEIENIYDAHEASGPQASKLKRLIAACEDKRICARVEADADILRALEQITCGGASEVAKACGRNRRNVSHALYRLVDENKVSVRRSSLSTPGRPLMVFERV